MGLTDNIINEGIIIALAQALIYSLLLAAFITAIILHELAHIKRNDYLINILQSLTEILMYYNPFVWWLNYIIRKERENCCDDLALYAGTEKLTYIKALAMIQDSQLLNNTGCIAFNYNLLNRLKRITAMKKSTNYLKERSIAALGTIIIFSGLAISTLIFTANNCTAVPPQEKQRVYIDLNKYDSEQDTILKKGSATVKTTWTDPEDKIEKDVRMSIESGSVQELIIDGITIPEDEYYKYEALINKTISDYERAMDELEDLDLEEIEKEVKLDKKAEENKKEKKKKNKEKLVSLEQEK